MEKAKEKFMLYLLSVLHLVNRLITLQIKQLTIIPNLTLHLSDYTSTQTRNVKSRETYRIFLSPFIFPILLLTRVISLSSLALPEIFSHVCGSNT